MHLNEANTHPFWARCPNCGHCWTVCYLPMDLLAASKLMRAARCPHGCAAPALVARQERGTLLEEAGARYCDFCGAPRNAGSPDCAPPFDVRPHQWTGLHPADRRNGPIDPPRPQS